MRTSLAIVLLGLGAGCATQDRSVAPAREFLELETRRLEDAWHRGAEEHQQSTARHAVPGARLVGGASPPSTLTFEPAADLEDLEDRRHVQPAPLASSAPPSGVGAEVGPPRVFHGPHLPVPAGLDAAPATTAPLLGAIAGETDPPSEVGSDGGPDSGSGARPPVRSWPPPWSAQREGGRPGALPGRRSPKRLALPPCPSLPVADPAPGRLSADETPPPADVPPLADGGGPQQVHLFGGAKEMNGAFTWGPCTPFRDDPHPTSHSDYEFAERPIASILGLRLSF